MASLSDCGLKIERSLPSGGGRKTYQQFWFSRIRSVITPTWVTGQRTELTPLSRWVKELPHRGGDAWAVHWRLKKLLDRWARHKAFRTVGRGSPESLSTKCQNSCASNSSLSGICAWFFTSVIPAIRNVLSYFKTVLSKFTVKNTGLFSVQILFGSLAARSPNTGRNQGTTVFPDPLKTLGN